LFPALIDFGFSGRSEYLEDLVARIDSPRLNLISIGYLSQLHDFRVAQLLKFIDRSEDPEISLIRHADVMFSRHSVHFDMYPCPESRRDWGRVIVMIEGQPSESQASHVVQVFSQPSTMLSRVLHLKISSRQDDILDGYRNMWPHLLRQLSHIRTLHVSRDFSGYIALALEGITGEMATGVLPVVDLIYLDGQPVSCIGQFLAARQLSGHPITIVETEAEFDERVESYVE